ncbi:MAG: hypothetical protein J6S63_12410 [Atopobiaceae bacterium]|nr:hypothetical protein [Atopobiaceae bacterium]
MTGTSRMRVTVFGTRGSIPVSGGDFVIFGGNTSCYLVEAGGESIFLDAGSGLANAPTSFGHAPVILLSHLHMDHLLGLGMYARLSQPGAATQLYVPAHDAREAKRAVDRLYSHPLWPLELSDYGGDLAICAMSATMRFGEVQVQTEQGNHPGGCRLIKIRHGHTTLVYATDFEHDEEACARLAAFAHDADLLLYDGQYDEDAYDAHRGFGHSTPAMGAALKKRCGAKRLLVVHHDPRSTDQELLAREQALGDASMRFAREGEVIEL